MTKQEFLTEFDQVIEANPGTTTGAEKLSELDGWDSLAVLGFIAMADEQLGAAVSGQQIADANTVDDLVALVNDKLDG
jgi:acyl carrier protein